jgi:integrase
LTAKIVEEYDGKATYGMVDRRWIESFDKWMETKKILKTNTRSIHLRNMRTVFNWGLDNEYTTNYPFRKNTIKKEETKKKALSIDMVRKLLAYVPHKDCASHIIYRDIFMLMIYLRGINISDLMKLKHEDVREGRVEYRRNKTGILYSVKIEPEAQVILEKYKGKEYLLNLDPYFSTAINRMLKRFGEIQIVGQRGEHKITPLLPSDVSSNSARHTWATLAIEADIPKEIVSLGLGHIIGSRTTEIYIDRKQQKKIDEANRRVIDYICGKYTPED